MKKELSGHYPVKNQDVNPSIVEGRCHGVPIEGKEEELVVSQHKHLGFTACTDFLRPKNTFIGCGSGSKINAFCS